jgi:hypothetical protein
MILLVGSGFREPDILEWSLDKFYLYAEEASKYRIDRRKEHVTDTLGAIGGAFSKEGIKDYIKALDEAKGG